MRFLNLLLVFLFSIHISSACFSRGNSHRNADEEDSSSTESQGLKFENEVRVEQLRGNEEEEEEKEKEEEKKKQQKPPAEQDPDQEPEFLEAYLKEFGHLKKSDSISQGIKNFQNFLGIKPTGKPDLHMLQKMSWKRCANTDKGFTEAPQIWERDRLFWNLNTTPPHQFPLQEIKELINQAFRAWEIVIAMDFLETQDPDQAQIMFSFKDPNGTMPRTGKTGLAVASATSPPRVHIVISNDEQWATFQTQEEVLIHQIGHALGLKHSGDSRSVMFPMFERPVGEQLPVISNDDVERLRALYALFGQQGASGASARVRQKRESNAAVLCCTCPVPVRASSAGRQRVVVPINQWMEMLNMREGGPLPLTKGDQQQSPTSRPMPPASSPSLTSFTDLPQLPDLAPLPTAPEGQKGTKGTQGTKATAGSAATAGQPGNAKPEAAPSADEGSTKKPEKCPHSITTVANVNPDTLFVFSKEYTWHFNKGKLAGGPYKISEFFPDGPDYADVAFSSGRLTVLIKERMLFGYLFDSLSAQFTRDRRYPRELHSRILFYPQAAFPIANGSIILIQDDVFATYNVESNTPHMLGSVSETFPGLPQELRSGFPASPDFATYYMLTNEYAFLYDVRSSRSISSQPIGQFLGCDQSPRGSVQGRQMGRPMPQPFVPSRGGSGVKFERPVQTGMGPPGITPQPLRGKGPPGNN